MAKMAMQHSLVLAGVVRVALGVVSRVMFRGTMAQARMVPNGRVAGAMTKGHAGVTSSQASNLMTASIFTT